MAWNRLKPLKEQLKCSEMYCQHYVECMNKVIDCGYAGKVPEHEVTVEDGKSIWYIPDHGLYYSKEPNKIRLVFDCSAQHQAESLNSHLLQGTDLTNYLTGILCRFHLEPIALMCDIEVRFSLRILAAGEKCNCTGEYCERSSLSE